MSQLSPYCVFLSADSLLVQWATWLEKRWIIRVLFPCYETKKEAFTDVVGSTDGCSMWIVSEIHWAAHMLSKAEFSWLSFFYTYRQITEPKQFPQVNWQHFQVLICSETLHMYFYGRSAFLRVVFAFKKHADRSFPTENFNMPEGSQPNRTAWTFKWIILIANALLALLLWVFFWTGRIIQLQLRQCFINSLFQVHWADIPTGFF